MPLETNAKELKLSEMGASILPCLNTIEDLWKPEGKDSEGVIPPWVGEKEYMLFR